MYDTILLTLDGTPTDRAIIEHTKELAKLAGSRIVLLHVADGWAARNINQLDLRESEEMRGDRQYIEGIADSLESDGYNAEAILAGGDPAKEIAACAVRENCDLIAMAPPGPRGLSDVIRGSVASERRHIAMVPVLMVRGTPSPSPTTPRPAA